MTAIHQIASGVTNSVDTEPRKLVRPFVSLGRPDDVAAVAQSSTNSIFQLLRGSLASLGVAAGSGDADVNNSADVLVNPVMTLGEINDQAATDPTDTASAIALTKSVLARAGL